MTNLSPYTIKTFDHVRITYSLPSDLKLKAKKRRIEHVKLQPSVDLAISLIDDSEEADEVIQMMENAQREDEHRKCRVLSRGRRVDGYVEWLHEHEAKASAPSNFPNASFFWVRLHQVGDETWCLANFAEPKKLESATYDWEQIHESITLDRSSVMRR